MSLADDEVFVSSGASDELGDILDLFDPCSSALVIEPAYPAYVDASIIAGRRIVHLPASREDGFLPEPCNEAKADLIYLCSPNNPTGAVYSRAQLQRRVDFANDHGSLILFDAAYEAFIEDPTLPHSIMELPGAKTCAIEICSLSKTAGFTGTRLGYTVIPHDLVRADMSLHDMWVRNRTTKTNGVSYVIQRGAAAVFTPEGRDRCGRIWPTTRRTRRCSCGPSIRQPRGTAAGTMPPTSGCSARTAWAAGSSSTCCCTRPRLWAPQEQALAPVAKANLRFSTFGSLTDTEEAARRLLALLG